MPGFDITEYRTRTALYSTVVVGSGLGREATSSIIVMQIEVNLCIPNLYTSIFGAKFSVKVRDNLESSGAHRILSRDTNAMEMDRRSIFHTSFRLIINFTLPLAKR
jgi:hypothetical protein